jgi:hypothetical protein
VPVFGSLITDPIETAKRNVAGRPANWVVIAGAPAA